MIRTLLLLQLRRALVPFAIILLALHFGFLVLEWAINRYSNPPPAFPDVLNAVVAFACVGLALPFGAHLFAREFKENHFLFLHSLPLSRGAMWAILVGANFLAMLGSLALLFASRPSLIRTLSHEQARPALAAGVGILVVLFVAGTCFSLVFRRDLLVYLFGFFVTGSFLFVSLVLAMVCGSRPSLAARVGPPGGNPHVGIWAVSNLAGVLCFLLLSSRFFAAGEFTLFKVQLRNATVTLLSLAAVVLALLAGITFGLFGLLDPWDFQNEVHVSPGGKHVAVVERRSGHPQASRVRLIDAQSGEVVQHREKANAVQAWASDERSLTVLVKPDFPLGLSDSLVRVLPDSRTQNTRFWFSRIVLARMLQDGKILLVVADDETGRVVSFDSATGQMTELCQGELIGPPITMSARTGGVFVCFTGFSLHWRAFAPQKSGSKPASIWLIDAGAKQIPWAAPASEGSPQCVVSDTAFSSMQGCVKKLKELYPFTAGSRNNHGDGKAGAYLLGSVVGIQFEQFFHIDDAASVFYLEVDRKTSAGSLFVWDRRKSAWTKVAEKIADIPANTLLFQRGYLLSPYEVGLRLDPRDGLVLYKAESQGRYGLFLYDARLDRTLELATLEKSDRSAHLRRIFGAQAVLISYGTGPARRLLKYQPGSGAVSPVDAKALPLDAIRFINESGDFIFFQNPAIFRHSAGGPERQLWPPPPK